MKKIGILLSTILLLAGCSKENAPVNGSVSVIKAEIPDDAKITIGGEEGLTALWAENESIKVILPDNSVSTYTIEEGVGTKKATFTGTAELGGKEISAISPSGLYYGCFYDDVFFLNFPTAQQYSSTGINTKYLAMYANGTQEDMKFNYSTSVFRFRLYGKSAEAITSLSISSTTPISGFYGTAKKDGKIGLFTRGGNPTYNYIYLSSLPTGGITISTDESNPTVIDFVVLSDLKLSGLTLSVKLGDKTVNLQKKSDLLPQPGIIYNFPVTECKNVENPNLKVKIDAGDWVNFQGEITTIPTEKIAIKSVGTENAAGAVTAALAAIAKAESRIIFDLSEAYVEETTAQHNWINSKVKELYLPYTTTTIPQSCFSGNYLTKLYIPAATNSIGAIINYLGYDDLYFEVDPNNETYSSVDGVIYTNNGTTLYQYPIGVTECTFKIPDNVTSYSTYAFAYCSQITELTLNGNSVMPSGQNVSCMDKLNKIYCVSLTPSWSTPFGSTGSAAPDKIIYVPRSENQAVLHLYETAMAGWITAGWTLTEYDPE